MKKKKLIIILIVCIIGAVLLSMFLYFKDEKIDDGENKGKEISIVNKDGNLQDIGEKLIGVYMKTFLRKSDEDKDSIKNFKVKKEKILHFNNNEIVKKVDFEITPQNNKTHKSWGEIKDGKLEASWILKIKISDDYLCKIENKEKFKKSKDKSKIFKEAKEKEVQPIKTNNNYRLDGHKIQVTYNKGKSWIDVPVDAKILIERRQPLENPNKLQDGSFIITPKNISFVYGGSDKIPVTMLSSKDKGKTWKTYVVTDETQGSRLLFIDFLNDKNGHVIVTGDRAMSWEMTYIYDTNNDGITWNKIGDPSKITNLLVNGAAFSTNKIGFICYKAINDSYSVKYTTNKGVNWNDLKLPMPSKYKNKFIEAKLPKFNGKNGSIIVAQMAYGGIEKKEKAKFITKDYGLTWKFDGIVTN